MNNLPVIPTPIFPRYLWMEEITYSHIPIATFITAAMMLAPLLEWIGYRKNDLRYDRFANRLIWFSMIIFSPGAALGTGIPMVIIGLYPEFWARWSNLFFWPLIGQFVFFLFEVLFLFFFYYLTWDRWMEGRKKRLHIAMGVVAAFWGVLIQFVWDGVGSYMLTPNDVPLPGVGTADPVGWDAAAFFNPTLFPLFFHRIFGNISWVMLITGGIFALKYMNKTGELKEYYKFSSDLAFMIGFIAFFAMPFIGWWYSEAIEANAPVAFNAIMGGHTAKYFKIKLGAIAFFVVVGSLYVFVRHREKKRLHYIVTGLLVVLYGFLTVHPPVEDFPGGAIGWRATYTVLLGGFVAYLWYLRGYAKEFSPTRKRWPRVMFIAGLMSFVAFAMGGFSRERARAPHTVYGQLVKPEATDMEVARFLVYQNCLDDYTIRELMELDLSEWSDTRILSSLCGTGNYTDEQAERIVAALREGSI